MTIQTTLHDTQLTVIIDRCRDESRQARDKERGYCFELFRRAIDQQSQLAWMAIRQQYQHLLMRWARARLPDQPPEEIESLAQQSLERFWRTASTQANFIDRFNHVGELLKYLQKCVLSITFDYQRRLKRRQELADRLNQAEQSQPLPPTIEQTALDQVTYQEQLQAVRNWIDDQVTDPLEKLVLSLSFEQELSPLEIVARYPAEFPDVRAVHKVKERILKRLRRAFSL